MIVITTPALRAAERVREQCRVTEHRRPEGYSGHIAPRATASDETEKRILAERQRVREMLEKRISCAEICVALGISISSLKRRIRALKAAGNLRLGGLNRKPIEIEGVRYESIVDAKNAMGRSSTMIYKWLREGKARHV